MTKINFGETGDRPEATGSLYRADPRATGEDRGIPGRVFASKEVIIFAVAFSTPQLLKLSDVSPASELQSFDITVVIYLPGVGGNMQNRYEMGIVGKAPTDCSLFEKCTFLDMNGTHGGEGPVLISGRTASAVSKVAIGFKEKRFSSIEPVSEGTTARFANILSLCIPLTDKVLAGTDAT
ncbi:oxygen-dependent choline dehydrogenase [Colletotrichum liriopes]|uniref:Oxygen-dependent choline dehydrogenase n=1 Tax=Colletotrichum liriopes TaxID=708192 RepID=A0AA37GH76_9PEZI|nr:oxygen-dependent choline dehydrogenase [Colletotrichum liriopes]